MDLDEGGLRYSDNKYFDPFSSDDEASEDDIFEGRCDEQTYVPCPLEEAGRTRTVHQSAELSQSIATAEDIENVAAEQVGGSEERIHKEFPQFNGKDLAMLTMNDMKGVYFPTLDAAEELYALHSKLLGFSVRKDRLETDVNGLGIRRQWVCSKQGEAVSQRRQRKKGVCGNKTGKENTSALPKKHKRNIVPRGRRYTRVNCPASFSVHYCPERQSYYVHRFLHEHNHDLALSAEVQFLRSHRCVQPHQLAQAEVLRELEVHTSKVYEHLVEQAGGHEAVGFTLKDLYNRLADKRRSAEIEGDAQSALTWMNMRGVESDQFFCRYQKDEEGRLAHLFWRDAQSLLDYQVYGDVLIMDSTYKTNMYGKPLVVFVGSNNHRATIVFGFALVADEKEDTYRWVFEKFLESMNQKQPSAILTDQDEAIRNAVQLLMPDSKHRLCAWHIGRNIGQNVKDPEAQKSIGQMIYASLTPREWEVAWHSLVARHGLSDNGWVSSLYMKRERWAEAFFRGHFYGGMCSTQRVECFHSKLKRDVGRYKRMCEVLPMSERTLARIRNRVLYDNFRAKNSAPVYETHMRGIEEEACREFTHDIFVMIKAQILFEKKFVVAHKQSFPLSDSVMFYLTQYERPGRHWSVEFVSDPVHPKWLCSCKSFESDGIPCCHIFCVLKAQLVSHFPKTLIRERWTKKAGDMTLAPLTRRTSNFKSAQVARYSALMLEAILPVVEKVGRFIKLDKRTEQKKSYVDARVCVEINLTTPLKRVVMVSDEHDVDVMRVWVSYEHLFVICFECGSHKHKLWRCPIRYPEQHFVMVDRAESDDEMEPIQVEVDPAIKEMINENVMLYFPQHGRGEKPHDDGRIEEREEEITKYLVMGNSSERVIQARNEEDDGCSEEARKQLIMKGNTINNKKRNRDSMEGNNKAGLQPKDGGSDQSVANYAGRM